MEHLQQFTAMERKVETLHLLKMLLMLILKHVNLKKQVVLILHAAEE